VKIRPMEPGDAADVLRIYQTGLDGGEASFETSAPTWAAFVTARLDGHSWVAVEDDQVLGWIAVTAVSPRPVYAGVVEHSVYVDPAAWGRGVARALLDALIASTEAAGIWTIESKIFPENTASLALHRAAGFRVIGTRHRIGCHQGRPGHPGGWWRDTILIERRSSVTG
jgi:L-amino acid N-acyltransferase YncA